jgi:uncharacterized protein YjiS (DUF1127 family)
MLWLGTFLVARDSFSNLCDTVTERTPRATRRIIFAVSKAAGFAAHGFSQTRAALRRNRIRRETIRDLRSLGSHALKDIGMTTFDIDRVASEMSERKVAQEASARAARKTSARTSAAISEQPACADCA